jgi:CDGSH-type Zn-finger protein
VIKRTQRSRHWNRDRILRRFVEPAFLVAAGKSTWAAHSRCGIAPSPRVRAATIRSNRFSTYMATKVTVVHNGPIRIEGEFEIQDPSGKTFGLAGRTAISLCRCGQSANKPFCDGAHRACGFTHTVEARELPPPQPKPL